MFGVYLSFCFDFLKFYFSCGKTTVCQLYSHLRNNTLLSVNCHMHTESSDFIGGLRPVRERSKEVYLFPLMYSEERSENGSKDFHETLQTFKEYFKQCYQRRF